MSQFMNIGFDNMVALDKIVAIISPESAPVKRIVQTGKENGTVIDVTHGRKTRSVVVTASGTLFLSALQPETLVGRLDP